MSRHDAAKAPPEPLPRRALEQRERLQALWLAERTARLRSDDLVRRLRRERDALRNSLPVRLATRIRRLAHPIVARRTVLQRGPLRGRGPTTPSAPVADAPPDPRIVPAAMPLVVIHIGATTREAAATWGDLPYAESLGRAFHRRGWRSTVAVHAESRSDEAAQADLAIHLFGSRAPTVVDGQPSVLWIISHPDHVTRALCRPYDLVGVASIPFLADLRAWLDADASRLIHLPQATDPDRFRPEGGGPRHDLLFVGSSRDVRRAIIEDLGTTHHELAVYGRGWRPDLLDPRHLRGEWISNDELHRYYAAAGIVLNDAHADMSAEGFIPNRVYDALASGAFVISESIPGLEEAFDGNVPTYRDGDELRAMVDHYLAAPEERRRMAEAGRELVLRHHTFDHRVGTILEHLEGRLPLGRPREDGR